jgi:ATP-dependent Clp protease ATP-binding subunit ClpC
VLVFEALTREQIRSIVDVQVKRIEKHLAEQEIRLLLSAAARDQLAEEGWSPEFGARPLKRAIQRHVQNLLADAILNGKLKHGDLAWVDYDKGAFRVLAKPQEPAPTELAGT